MANRRWSDLSQPQKAGVIAAALGQLALLGAALADLRRRPSTQLRGSKRLWTAAVFVNFVGPLAYFLLGRRRPGRPGSQA